VLEPLVGCDALRDDAAMTTLAVEPVGP